MDALPAVLLLQVLEFLDHEALHAAEQSSHAILALTREHGASSSSAACSNKRQHALTFRRCFACLQSCGGRW